MIYNETYVVFWRTQEGKKKKKGENKGYKIKQKIQREKKK